MAVYEFVISPTNQTEKEEENNGFSLVYSTVLIKVCNVYQTYFIPLFIHKGIISFKCIPIYSFLKQVLQRIKSLLHPSFLDVSLRSLDSDCWYFDVVNGAILLCKKYCLKRWFGLGSVLFPLFFKCIYCRLISKRRLCMNLLSKKCKVYSVTVTRNYCTIQSLGW